MIGTSPHYDRSNVLLHESWVDNCRITLFSMKNEAVTE